jgi:hypothetical protein
MMHCSVSCFAALGLAIVKIACASMARHVTASLQLTLAHSLKWRIMMLVQVVFIWRMC